MFPDAEDCEVDRDRYPVRGWKIVNGVLLCRECATEVYTALAALRDGRKRKAGRS